MDPLLDGELGRHALQALLELAEELLPGHQARRPGLEHGPSTIDGAAHEQHHERRLARARLTDHEGRARGRVQQKRRGRRQRLANGLVLDPQLVFAVALDEAPHRLQEWAIQRLTPPGVQLGEERLRVGVADGAQQGLRGLPFSCGRRREGAAEPRSVTEGGTSCQVLGHERRNQRVLGPAFARPDVKDPEAAAPRA